MIIINNLDLSKKTTMKIGGNVDNFFIPDSTNELVELVGKIGKEKYYIISGGSNILINDEKTFKNVISMEKVDNSIDNLGNGKFYIGASNRIQLVISKINSDGYGGIEELYSLPALFGGIIYMNAGIGPSSKPLFTISEFVEKVKVLNKNNRKIEWIKKNDCLFGHRSSIFQNDEYIILGAECVFLKQSQEKSKERIQNRIKHCKESQEWGKGCFGTCFSVSNRKLLKILYLTSFNKHGVFQSSKNCNWLVNDGTGKYKDAIKIINKAKKIHKFFHKPLECEVRIWD